MSTKHPRKEPAATSARTGAAESEGQRSEEQPGKKTVRINRRFLLILLILSVSLGGGTYALHSVQMERTAASLLDLVDEAEQGGKTDDAIKYLRQYIRFRPKDYDAKIRFADLIEQGTRDYLARMVVLRLLEEVLRNDPDRADADTLRRRAADLAIGLGKYRDALAHVDVLSKRDASDPELVYLVGLCREGLGDHSRAVFSYLDAIQRSDETIDAYVRLAGVLLQHPGLLPHREDFDVAGAPKLEESLKALFPKRPAESKAKPDETPAGKAKVKQQVVVSANDVVERLYDRLVKRGRPRHSAFTARADYWLSRFYIAKTRGTPDPAHPEKTRYDLAQEDINTALALAPEDPDVLLKASSLALIRAEQATLKDDSKLRKGFLARADGFARRGVRLPAPKSLRFYTQLAAIEQQRASFAEEQARTAHYDRAETQVGMGLAALKSYRESGEDDVKTQARLLLLHEIRLLMSQLDILLARARANGVDVDRARFQAELARLKKLGAAPVNLELFQATELFQQKQWRNAATKLVAIRPVLQASTSRRRQIDLALAECYRQLHDPTARVQVLQQGLAVDLTWREGRLQLAAALAARGRIDEALTHYKLLMD
ncbi:MAG: tetratricopeptide repeat protein, partial [Planctomycetaceae bacterium]